MFRISNLVSFLHYLYDESLIFHFYTRNRITLTVNKMRYLAFLLLNKYSVFRKKQENLFTTKKIISLIRKKISYTFMSNFLFTRRILNLCAYRRNKRISYI